MPAEVPGEGNVKIGAVQWTPPAEMAGNVALVWLDLLDAKGQPVAQHLYTFGVPAPAKARQPILAPLLKAPRTTLKSASARSPCQAQRRDRSHARDSQHRPVARVVREGRRADAGSVEPGKIPPRLDWAYFNHNYFSLPPGESRRVRMTLAPHAPKQPTIRDRGVERRRGEVDCRRTMKDEANREQKPGYRPGYCPAMSLCRRGFRPTAGSVADDSAFRHGLADPRRCRRHRAQEQRLFEADPSSPGWIPATVPGNIQADLEAAHQLKPLWYGAGDPRLDDVAQKGLVVSQRFYRSGVVCRQAAHAGLRRRGPAQCEVWLNGQQIGANAGMFRRFRST